MEKGFLSMSCVRRETVGAGWERLRMMGSARLGGRGPYVGVGVGAGECEEEWPREWALILSRNPIFVFLKFPGFFRVRMKLLLGGTKELSSWGGQA